MNTNLSNPASARPADDRTRPYAWRIQSSLGREGAEKPAAAGPPSPDESYHPIVSVGARMSDDHLVSAIAHTLEWNRITPGNSITAVVCRGHVTLAGYVHSRQDREEAEMLVKRLPGVHSIDNRVEVLTDDVLSGRLKSAIINVLRRHGGHVYRDIGVEMNNGRVVLTGKVGSRAEKRLVLDALGWAPYVHAIEDRLEVVTE